MKKISFRNIQFTFLFLAFAVMVWGFKALIFSHAPATFMDPMEDMSFGWYVPLFSLYVIWIEREKIKATFSEPSIIGLLLTLPCLAIGFLGVRGIQIRFEIIAFIGLLLTVPWALFGRKTAKAILFPVGFLLFCIPLATFLDVITIHLRLFASSIAYQLLVGFGLDVIRKGTMILASDGSFSIDIAEPCSGLRSIFALMALTAAYAYFKQPTLFRKAFLFSMSIPLAVLGNVVRILTICLVAGYASKDFAVGFYHDYSGYVVFLVAIFSMVLVSEGIDKLCTKKEKSNNNNDKEKSNEKIIIQNDLMQFSNIKRSVIIGLLFMLVSSLMIFQAMTPKVTLTEAPKLALYDIPGFDSYEEGASEAELNVLPKDTQIIRRHYTSKDNSSWYRVSVVIGGAGKSSIHRPELCLPGQGFQMVNPRTINVAGTDWRFITLQVKDQGEIGFLYTFFNQAGFQTASHTRRIFQDVLDRSILNRIDRWVMVTINASHNNDFILSQFAQRIKGMLK